MSEQQEKKAKTIELIEMYALIIFSFTLCILIVIEIILYIDAKADISEWSVRRQAIFIIVVIIFGILYAMATPLIVIRLNCWVQETKTKAKEKSAKSKLERKSIKDMYNQKKEVFKKKKNELKDSFKSNKTELDRPSY